MCFRLLGAALPLLSKEQMQLMMQGDLIRFYGQHVVTVKVGFPQGFRAGTHVSQLLGRGLSLSLKWINTAAVRG